MKHDKWIQIGMIVGLLAISAPVAADKDVDCETADATPALAEQIALSIDDIDKVDNRIQVLDEVPEAAKRVVEEGERGFGDRVRDATTTASVKSRLLWNRNTAGLAIKVSTENGVVRLEGEADSSASRDQAGRLAANTDGVDEVINNIEVVVKDRPV